MFGLDALWAAMYGMEWYGISIVLALMALGFVVPLRSAIFTWGTTYRQMRARYWMLINPILEELIFRLCLLTILFTMFEPLSAILILTALYMVYSGCVYGPVFAADGLVLGIFFSLAFVEFGFVIVLVAHIFYKMVQAIW